MASGSILLVDDNPQFCKMYTDFLSVHGYTVITAESGAEGIDGIIAQTGGAPDNAVTA